MHFRVFSKGQGTEWYSKVKNIFWLLKFQIFFWVLGIPDICLVNG